MTELEYWKQRCLLAEQVIAESPCDDDITEDQIAAWGDYRYFLNTHKIEE